MLPVIKPGDIVFIASFREVSKPGLISFLISSTVFRPTVPSISRPLFSWNLITEETTSFVKIPFIGSE